MNGSAAVPPGGGFGVSRIARRRFPNPPAVTGRPGHLPHLRRYLADLTRPYGVALREEALAAEPGQSYGEMGAALIAATVPPDSPVDLLVLAYAVPDIRPGRATATYLGEVCPGRPLAFAVSDQGSAAAYTGLRLVGEYLRTGCRRALLLVMEQAAGHYQVPAGVPLPDRHAGVALVCEPAAAVRVSAVRLHPDLPPADLDARLAAAHADLAAGAAGEVIPVRGTGLPGGAGPVGQPTTGSWWGLAGDLARPATRPRRWVLADYDPLLGYLCLAGFEAPAG